MLRGFKRRHSCNLVGGGGCTAESVLRGGANKWHFNTYLGPCLPTGGQDLGKLRLVISGLERTKNGTDSLFITASVLLGCSCCYNARKTSKTNRSTGLLFCIPITFRFTVTMQRLTTGILFFFFLGHINHHSWGWFIVSYSIHVINSH